MSFQEFLNYLSGPGVNAAVGFVLSFIVEFWPRYNDLEAKQKRLLFLALCFGLPVLAAALKVAFGYAAPSWDETFWPAVVAGFTAFTAGQVAHLRALKA